MSRLTEKINCIECGNERMITKACLKIITRCKACQKIFNRTKARNRYRKTKGISTDAPVGQLIKKKKKKKKEKSKEKSAALSAPPKSKPETKVVPAISPEERERRSQAMAKLLEIFTDKSTVDDW